MHRTHGLALVAFAVAFVAAFVLMPAQSASAFNTYFNFDGHGIGTPAEAVSASGFTFSSPDSPNSWQVQSSAGFASLSGNVLRQTDCKTKLVIELEKYQHTLSMDFAITGGQRVQVKGYVGPLVYSDLRLTNTFYGSPNGLSDNVYEGSLVEDVQGMNFLVFEAPEGCLTIDDLRFDDGLIVMIPGHILETGPRVNIPLPPPLPLPVEPIVLRGN